MPKRDDFTVDTIRRAASRVGYRCSFPGCTCATIGPSMESSSKVSTLGVGAHICAAAENGPRFDPNMTTEERKSIDNCIWMCQIHAKLIDTDVIKYSVETLRKWKAEAEEDAASALADVNFFSTHYASNGDNLEYLETLFEGFIVDGDFDKLKGILYRYTNNLSDYYNEIVLRYKIIFDCYCLRNKLNEDICEYTKLSYKFGINHILKYLISFNLKEQISSLIEYCKDNEIISISNFVLTSNFAEKLFTKSENDKPFQCSKKIEDTINKFLANHLFIEKCLGMKAQDGNLVKLYDYEYYYKIQSMIFELMRKATTSHTFDDNDFEPLKLKLKKVNQLDLSLKIPLISNLLNVFVKNKNIYLEILSYCDDTTKQSIEIRGIEYIYKILNEPDDLSPEDIISYCNLVNDFRYIEMYSSALGPDKELRFIEENQYLFNKSCYFIYRLYVLGSDETKSSIIKKLSKFADVYHDSFDFKCIVLLIKGKEDLKELDWLSSNLKSATLNGIMLYIDVLSKFKKYTELYDLSKKIFNNYILYNIARRLQMSGKKVQIKQSKKIYKILVNSGYKEEGLLFDLSLAQKELGELENAKESIKREYQQYGKDNALLEYLYLRYITNEFKDDEFLLEAKISKNATLQNLVGATLAELHNYSEAFKYCLRSLLIDKNNTQCLKGMFTLCSNIPEASLKITNENCVIKVKNHKKTVHIAIYEPSLIEGLSPNDFADCIHLSSDNPVISQLLFSKIGEEVEVFDDSFVVDKIIPLTSFISQISLASIINDPKTIKFSGDSTNELIENITNFLKQSSEKSERIINEYNNANIRYPLSIFAEINGKSMLNTQEFLIYGNTEKIRNNVNMLNFDRHVTNIILSYDSIVLLSKLDLLKHISKTHKLICPPYIAEKMQMEIKNEISKLTDDKTKGCMSYTDGRLSLIEHNTQSRAVRHRYLTELKAFIDSVDLGERLDYIPSNEELWNSFADNVFVCEKSCLALASKMKDSILLTDDQFLYTMARMEGIKSIGLLCLICGNQESIKTLVENAKKLIDLNFAQYLSLDIYNQALKILKDDSDNELLKQLLLFDKTGEEATDYHRNLIISLYRDFVNQNGGQIISQDAFHDIAIIHFMHLHPEILNNAIERYSMD